MGGLRFFRGEARVRITGACPQDCLNALSGEAVEFWDICREDTLHYCVSLRPAALSRAEKLGLRTFCTVECLWQRGLKWTLVQALKRPVLLLGLAGAFFLLFFLQSFVWTIEVDGCETIHPETVVRALEELGIHCGSWAGNIAYKEVRNELLNLVPELSWAAVNRSGGKLHVLVTERQSPPSAEPPYPAANLIAVRDGVLTEVSVLEGMRLCAVGDTVRAGQLLVSGVEDYGLYLRGVCAQGEIYGQTWRSQTLVTPAMRLEKHYTGREWTRVSLIVGRKRINLCGNSGISGVTCDKMVDVKEATLPGYTFPVRLETETYREYETVAVPKQRAAAQKKLENAFVRMTQAGMRAGRIEQADYRLESGGALLILRCTCTCNEMLARLSPINAIYEGESHE